MSEVKLFLDYRSEEINIGCKIYDAPPTPCQNLREMFQPERMDVRVLDGVLYQFEVSGPRLSIKTGARLTKTHRDTYNCNDKNHAPEGAQWLWQVLTRATGWGPWWNIKLTDEEVNNKE